LGPEVFSGDVVRELEAVDWGVEVTDGVFGVVEDDWCLVVL
jgi:hypothetical protein